jgi:uncharacterized protein with PIN domain
MSEGKIEGMKCPKCGFVIIESENLESEKDIELYEQLKSIEVSCPKCGKDIRLTKSQIRKKLKTKVKLI